MPQRLGGTTAGVAEAVAVGVRSGGGSDGVDEAVAMGTSVATFAGGGSSAFRKAKIRAAPMTAGATTTNINNAA